MFNKVKFAFSQNSKNKTYCKDVNEHHKLTDFPKTRTRTLLDKTSTLKYLTLTFFCSYENKC